MKVKKDEVFIENKRGIRFRITGETMDRENIAVIDENSGQNYFIRKETLRKAIDEGIAVKENVSSEKVEVVKTKRVSLLSRLLPAVFRKKSCMKEIEYFHPEGKSMPDGVYVQKGGFCEQCMNNKKKFAVKGGAFYELDINGEYVFLEASYKQYDSGFYKGCIIVFGFDASIEEQYAGRLLNGMKRVYKTFQQQYYKDKTINSLVNRLDFDRNASIGGFSTGNFFTGRYISANGTVFNPQSLSIAISGVSTKGVKIFAEMAAEEFRHETLLLRSMNNCKIYLINGERVKREYEI